MGQCKDHLWKRFGFTGDVLEFLKGGNSWNVLARTELLLG